ncbi:MAG: peptidoglycan DD-metalloendopeptidase family protein [Nitrospirae bacterium]|nr:peptidoglycan DD-metalloendopeptidase family protein [Nitrospirota bacterium]
MTKAARFLAIGLLGVALLAWIPLALGESKKKPPQHREEDLRQIQRELKEKKERLQRTKAQERSVLAEIEAADQLLAAKEDELRQTQRRVRELEQQLARARQEVQQTEQQVDRQKRWLRERLRALYKQGREGTARVLLAAPDLHALLKRYHYLQMIAEQDQRLIARHQQTLALLEERSARLETQRQDVLRERERLDAQREGFAEQRRKKSALLAHLRKEKTGYERLVKELEEAAARLSALLRSLPERKEALPYRPDRSFAAFKGRLEWPTVGKVLSFFGKQKDLEFQTAVFKKGIEIQSRFGEEFRAVFDGAVVFADWFKGYGLMVILYHGEQHYSLYAHAAELFTKVGDRVGQNQALGRVGGSGVRAEPSLYFEIRRRSDPEDPLLWLKKRR